MNSFRKSLLNTASARNAPMADHVSDMRLSKRMQSTGQLSWKLADHSLRNNERGLVISAPVTIDKDNSISGGGSIDPDLMRFFLLFWDKFDWPDNRLISVGEPDEHIRYLMELGIVQRSIVSGTGRFQTGGELIINSQLGAFRELENRNPGKWSLAKGSGCFSFSDRELENGRGILFGLHRAIPVPDRSVPFQDILEFKEKRRDELSCLRYHLEQIFQRILASPDAALAKTTEFEKFDKAIGDYVRAVRERPFRLRLSDLSANLNVTDVVAGVLASLGSSAAELPLSSTLLNGVGSAISVNVGAKLIGYRQTVTPYQYIGSVHRSWL